MFCICTELSSQSYLDIKSTKYVPVILVKFEVFRHQFSLMVERIAFNLVFIVERVCVKMARIYTKQINIL